MPPISRNQANILGVGIDAVDMASAVATVSAAIASGRKGYVCVTGVHGIMEAQRDERLRHILNDSLLTVPDGMPTVWVGKWQGFRCMDRVYGPDLMVELCRLSLEKRYTHFLYGGKPGVAERLRRALMCHFPGICIVGSYCPPFRHLDIIEAHDLQQQVAALKPDLFWVGLSTPKQEQFMAEFLAQLETTVMLGVGAAFDIHAGLLKDSPPWLKAAGLQWLHRLVQEPGRLWARYLINNPQFMVKVSLQLAGVIRYRTPNQGAKSGMTSQAA